MSCDLDARSFINTRPSMPTTGTRPALPRASSAGSPIPRGEAIGPEVLQATAASEGIPAGRPKTIRCNPEIFHRLKDAARALGARLVAAEHLPAVEEVARSLSSHMGPLVFTLTSPGDWCSLIGELVSEAPWTQLHDQIWFELHHPELEGWIGLVLGQAGKQRGISFCPNAQMLDALHEVQESGLPPDFDSVCIHVDPLDEVGLNQRRWAEANGLIFDGLALVAFRMGSEGPRPLEHAEERLWLAATRAVLEVWKTHGATLLTDPTTTSVLTPAGPFEVRTTVVEEAEVEPFVPEPHLLFLEVGHATRRVCFKAAKRDAERIAKRLLGVQALVIEHRFAEVHLSVRLEDDTVISVANMPANADFWWSFKEEAVLVAMKGGAKRRSYRVSDAILEHRVPIEGDSIFRPMDSNWRAKADYSGPPTTWPLASTVLLAFGEILHLDQMPRAAFENAVGVLSTIWNAVVLADLGTPSPLSAVRRQLSKLPGSDGLVDLLIQHKRSYFAEDSRVLEVEAITWAGGQANVRVKWRDGREGSLDRLPTAIPHNPLDS